MQVQVKKAEVKMVIERALSLYDSMKLGKIGLNRKLLNMHGEDITT
jgi:hypothetical protein